MPARACEGCGATLQSDDPATPGYVPGRVMQGTSRSFCRRCHRSRAHVANNHREDDTVNGLRRIIDTADLAVLIVDMLDFEGTFSRRLAQQCGRRLFIVGNRVDLLPGKTPRTEVLAWLQAQVNAAHVPNKGVFLTSAAKAIGVSALWDAIKKELGGRGTVAIVGVDGVGKSTLINAWSEQSTRQESKKKRPRRKSRKSLVDEAVTEPIEPPTTIDNSISATPATIGVEEAAGDERDTQTEPSQEYAVNHHSSSMPLDDAPDDSASEPPKTVSPPRRRRRPVRTRGRSRKPQVAPSDVADTPPMDHKQTPPEKPAAADAAGSAAPPPAKSVKRNRHRPKRRNPNAKKPVKQAVTQEPPAVVDVTPVSVTPANGAKVDRADIRVVEAPGIPGRGRINTLLCVECAQKTSPQKPLRSKALRMKPGQAAIFAGLAALAVRQVAPPEKTGLLLLFAPPGVGVQRVRESVLDQFLQNGTGAWSFEVCNECVERLRNNGWEEVEITLDTSQDLAIHGLGWISVRQSPVTIRVILPAGVLVSLRPRLVGPKDHTE